MHKLWLEWRFSAAMKTTNPVGDASNRLQEAYEKYAPDLRAYFSICFGDSMAEDLTQQLFLKLWVY